MGGLGRVWWVNNFITQTQPNLPSPKNRPNPAGWVGSGRVGFGGLTGFLHTPKLSMSITLR